ncbi:hypothetical protein [Klebsiella variicola]|uniref:hypothetical protein n=1 Tax=Klebsiella variicola TaxID=244366 RepID=UPI0011E4E7C4|nr:hypothetical protein [Klebsiella variicola]
MDNKYRYNHFYICGVYLNSDDVTPIAYKFGITSYNPQEYNDKRKFFIHRVIYSFATTKYNSKYIENAIKSNINCGYLAREFYGNGHTETIKTSELSKMVKMIWTLCDYDSEK